MALAWGLARLRGRISKCGSANGCRQTTLELIATAMLSARSASKAGYGKIHQRYGCRLAVEPHVHDGAVKNQQHD